MLEQPNNKKCIPDITAYRDPNLKLW